MSGEIKKIDSIKNMAVLTVPLDPSHPGCGKFIISSYFSGEHRGRHFALVENGRLPFSN